METAHLRALKDIAGVTGSFVLDRQGALQGADLPALFEPSLLCEVGPRIQRFAEAYGAGGEELDWATLRFAEHKLFVRQLPSLGFLCVLAALQVNAAALRMAVTLLGRKLAESAATEASRDTLPPFAPRAVPVQPGIPSAVAPGTSRAENVPLASDASAPSRAARPPEPATTPRPPPRMYRGRLIG